MKHDNILQARAGRLLDRLQRMKTSNTHDRNMYFNRMLRYIGKSTKEKDLKETCEKAEKFMIDWASN